MPTRTNIHTCLQTNNTYNQADWHTSRTTYSSAATNTNPETGTRTDTYTDKATGADTGTESVAENIQRQQAYSHTYIHACIHRVRQTGRRAYIQTGIRVR